MTINDKLRAMRERVEAATEGPWRADGFCDHHEDGREIINLGVYTHGMDGDVIAEDIHHHGNAGFIAHARTDLPKLLDAVERVIPIHFSRNGYCNECGGQHPCATVRAITEALDS